MGLNMQIGRARASQVCCSAIYLAFFQGWVAQAVAGSVHVCLLNCA